MKKKYFLILGVSLFIILLILYVFFLKQNTEKNITPILLPTPTIVLIPPASALNPPIPGQSNEYKGRIDALNNKEAPLILKDQQIINLKNSLPYRGKYFSLEYELPTNMYILSVSSQLVGEALTESDNYFKKYNVDKSSLRITTIYK